MELYDEIKNYCNTVCEQIRWKKARGVVALEIENHICDQRDAYMSEGTDQKTATHKAVQDMGNPVTIGQGLDRTHRPKPQWAMIAFVGILMAIGALSNYITGFQYNSGILPFIAAFGVFLICYFADFSLLGKYAVFCLPCILLLSVIGLFCGVTVNGRVWIYTFLPFNLAYLSLIFPLAYALLIYLLYNRGIGGILICGIGYLPFGIILLMVPTINGFLLFTISALFTLCLSVAKGWFDVSKKLGLTFILGPTALVTIFTALYIVQDPNLANRFSQSVGIHPEPLGDGYLQSLILTILPDSVFIGRGTASAESLSAMGPDYTLTLFIHSLGWIVLVGIVLFMAAFVVVGCRRMMKQKSMLGMLIASSIILPFILQSIFYFIDNLGLGCIGSLALPLVSPGKAILLINAALIGFMLSVFRTGDVFRDAKVSKKYIVSEKHL